MVFNQSTKKTTIIVVTVLGILCLFLVWQFYVPKSFADAAPITYAIEKGFGPAKIAQDLEDLKIIKSSLFFRLYTVILGKHRNLQAGPYLISSSIPVNVIVQKLVAGDVIKTNAIIIEGWNLDQVGQYLEDKDYYNAKDFLIAIKKDWSREFAFLQDKPKKLNLEGYVFPDTYQVYQDQSAEEFVKTILENFDKKLTPELRAEIFLQKKSIFEIITMASMLEKEVRTLEDKKIVSGLLWKRIDNGIGLNVDATVNYATGKNTASISTKDIQIDSPYNTYKYRGLPLGPISNPGLDSILAAIYPVKSPYWYYLSEPEEGQTIFSKTLEEHNAAVEKYLR